MHETGCKLLSRQYASSTAAFIDEPKTHAPSFFLSFSLALHVVRFAFLLWCHVSFGSFVVQGRTGQVDCRSDPEKNCSSHGLLVTQLPKVRSRVEECARPSGIVEGQGLHVEKSPRRPHREQPRKCRLYTRSIQVEALDLYLSKLHPSLDRFFQRAKVPPGTTLNDSHSHSHWYVNSPISHNLLNQFMKRISEQAHLSTLYTNHCLRATTIVQLVLKTERFARFPGTKPCFFDSL